MAFYSGNDKSIENGFLVNKGKSVFAFPILQYETFDRKFQNIEG